jgi:peroxiredoxin
MLRFCSTTSRDVLESTPMDALKLGDPAPDFDLPVFGPERLKLSDAVQNGPVILLAYLFDFSGG